MAGNPRQCLGELAEDPESAPQPIRPVTFLLHHRQPHPRLGPTKLQVPDDQDFRVGAWIT